MKAFDINNLFAIHGKTGLYLHISRTRSNSNVFARLVNPKETVVIFDKDANKLTKFSNVGVYVKDQEEPNTLESVIETLYAMADSGKPIPEHLGLIGAAGWDCSWDTITDFMNEALPNFDEVRFKPYHMDKILKWYHEIVSALKLIDVEEIEIIDPKNPE